MKKFILLVLIIIVAFLFFIFYATHRDRTTSLSLFLDTPNQSNKKLSSDAEQCVKSTGNIAKHIYGLAVPFLYANQEKDLAMLSDLNVKWIRTDMLWSDIAISDGKYEWNEFDNFVIEMQKRNIEILAVPNYIPTWITNWKDVENNFALFMKAAVERYKPNGTLAKIKKWNNYGIRYWEIFNEPNLPGVGFVHSASKAEPFVKEYARLLIIANSSIREKDTDAIILFGGLSPNINETTQKPLWEGGMTYIDFLNQTYETGVNNCFDGMAFHPYGFEDDFNRAVRSVRKIMDSYGEPESKPIWMNEFGTTDDAQKESLFRKSFAERNNMDAFFLFSLRDLAWYRDRYGLVKSDYSKRPVYDVFKELMNKR